ncbi:MAG: hypothetical protein AAB519_02420 [Patescibacteria group bacterium]
MTTPVGTLRNLFFCLYRECFGSELVISDSGRMILKNYSACGGEAHVILSWDEEDLEDQDATMSVTGCEDIFEILSTDGSEGAIVVTDHLYWVNESIINSHYNFFLNREYLVRDAHLLFELYCLSTSAHEIRHEIQNRGLIMAEQMHGAFPKCVDDLIISKTRVVEYDTLALGFRKTLLGYWKMLEGDKETLFQEIDALSIELQVMRAWVNNRTKPFQKRIQAVRDVIISTNEPGAMLQLPHPSG